MEKEMLNLAMELMNKRYPTGWGGVAVIRTDKGHYYTSVALETFNQSAALCIEVGAMCEATKYNEKITHSMCIVRADEKSRYKVLTPCGICQERLLYWGENVKVAISNKNNEIIFKSLKEIQNYHWTIAYKKDEIEHFNN